LMISCIGATHQFISKPCKPQDLIAIVQRGLALDACMSSDQIRSLAPKLRRLPSLPTAYFEVLKQVESSTATVQSVGEVIMRDPSLTAKLLQMINSAAFALAQKVTDPLDAVSLLGMETVKSLVLCLQVFSQNDAAKQSGISLEELWSHSVGVAKMAREITLFHTGDTLLANEAFTAGLLHDVGRIVMAANLPKEYAETVKTAKEQKRPLYVQEAAQFGVHHAQVGAYLMGLWGMPATVVEAAALHHNPSRTPAHEFSLLTAVHVADVFSHEKEEGKTELLLPKLDQNYLSALGLEEKPEVWRKMLAGEIVPLEKDGKAEKPAARRSSTPSAPLVPPLPTEVANGQNSPFNFLLPAAAAVVVSVSIIFFWQHAYQSNIIVQAKAAPDSTNNLLATDAVATPAPQAVDVVTNPTPDVVPAPPLVVTDTNAATVAIIPKSASLETTNSSPSTVVTNGFDSVKLEGILVDDSGASAILNGNTLSVGQSINDVLVEAISSNGVTLSYAGQEKVLKVK